MADQSETTPARSMPATLLIALMVLLGAGYQGVLESSRPGQAKDSRTSVAVSPVVEGIPLRLWEDPMKSVSASGATPPDQSGQEGKDAASIQVGRPMAALQRDLFEKAETTIIPILVPGSAKQREEERRRMRYALVSALLARDFQPGSTDAVGQLRLGADCFDPQDEPAPAVADRRPIQVPFEWFTKGTRGDPSGERSKETAAVRSTALSSSQSPASSTSSSTAQQTAWDPRVLVLWLDGDRLGSRPVAAMSALVHCVLNHIADRPPGDAQGHPVIEALSARPKRRDFVHVGVIGPTDSSGLVALRDEARLVRAADLVARSADSKPPSRTSIRFASTSMGLLSGQAAAEPVTNSPPDRREPVELDWYSPTATIPIPEDEAGASLRKAWGGSIRVIRTIGDDDALARTLVDELVNRQLIGPYAPFSWTHERPGVLLLSEADSDYSSRLEQGLSNEIRRRCEELTRCSIRRATFLRGLDGDPADTTGIKAPSARKGWAGLKDVFLPTNEAATGTRQFDYIQRLLGALDSVMTSGDGHPINITAIGLLGSDFYDKVLLMRALRRQYPKAQFFTTDIDARLFHDEDWRSTRNTIVAAHTGLASLLPTRRLIPPFRDNYQTALFESVNRLLDDSERYFADHRNLSSCPDDPKPCTIHARGMSALTDVWSTVPYCPRVDARHGRQSTEYSPMLFEVGRTQAILLNEAKSCAATAVGGPTRAPDIRGWLPRTGDGIVLRWRPTIVWTLIVLGLLMLIRLATRRPGTRAGRPPVALRRALRSWRRHHPRAAWLTRPATLWISIALAVLTILMVLESIQNESARGIAEPMLLTEAASMWPVEALRALAILFGIFLMFYMIHASDRMVDRVTLDIRMAPPGARGSWRPSSPIFDTRDIEDHPERVWERFVQHLQWRSMVVWVSAVSLILVAVGTLASAVVDGPYVSPTRGELLRWLDPLLFWGHVSAGAVVVSMVIYYSLLCGRLAQGLKGRASQWPSPCFRASTEDLGLAPTGHLDPAAHRNQALHEWTDFRLVQRVMTTLARFIYLPFLMLIIALLIRSSYFDRQTLPTGILLTLVLALLGAVLSAHLQRRTAEAVRSEALSRCADAARSAPPRIIPLGRTPQTGARSRCLSSEEIAAIEARIRGYDQGVFGRFSNQPFFRVILMSISGISGVGVMEWVGLLGL